MTTGYDSPLSGPLSRTEIPDGYYAVPDPGNAEVLTLWRVVNDHVKASPPKALWGPVLYRRDVPKGLSTPDRAAWIRDWFQRVRFPWDEAVRAAIAADPETAGALYAKTSIRCRNCAKPLTDATSKAAGRGPDCRASAAAWVRKPTAATPTRPTEEIS